MFKTREIKGKIATIQNLNKITSALELISAVKMKKAQRLALNSRPFATTILEILEVLGKFQKEIKKSIFFIKRPTKKILAVVVASDRGFCGAFNKNILTFAEREIQKMGREKVEIFAVGKKTIKFFQKKGYKIFEKITDIGDFGELHETKPIADKIIEAYLKNLFGEVFLFFTDFVSAFSQIPRKIQILPLEVEAINEILKSYSRPNEKIKPLPFILLEPSPKEIFENVVPQLIRQVVHHTVLETNAAEHSARMMAMKRATENAKEILNKLILDYNKARQAQITAEVCEITFAKEATK